MAASFQPESLKFLRGLAKNNDREWFEARRALYERALKAPMLAVIEEINGPMEKFAPEHVRPSHKIMMRIYRDIRFSKDKRPYKHHVSAWWLRRGLEKTEGGGFYLQVSPSEVLVAAGVYMPPPEQLLQVRRWMAGNHERYRKLVATAMKPPRGQKGSGVALTGVEPHALTRMPKGFPADHPAGDLLRAKHWGLQVTLPGEFALEPGFAKTVAQLFQRVSPVIEALNEAIMMGVSDRPASPRKPLF